MLQNQKAPAQNPQPSYRLSSKVQCVPGGHQISISEAYWCGSCNWYICYKHLTKAMLTTAIKCPKGHEVKKAS